MYFCNCSTNICSSYLTSQEQCILFFFFYFFATDTSITKDCVMFKFVALADELNVYITNILRVVSESDSRTFS